MEEEVINRIEVYVNEISYVGMDIVKNNSVYELLKNNRLHLPMNLFQEIKEENGIMLLKFKNGMVEKDLKNVSQQLYRKFLEEYNRGL